MFKEKEKRNENKSSLIRGLKYDNFSFAFKSFLFIFLFFIFCLFLYLFLINEAQISAVAVPILKVINISLSNRDHELFRSKLVWSKKIARLKLPGGANIIAHDAHVNISRCVIHHTSG